MGHSSAPTLKPSCPREVVDAAVQPGRHEMAPVAGTAYVAFVDPSGGSADSMTLAIAHRDVDGRAILDAIRCPQAAVQPRERGGGLRRRAAALRRR